jgi:hypothetical protein
MFCPLNAAAFRLSLCAFAISCVFPSAVRAHHEAIFGPQSSLVFSEPGYLSTQLYSRNIGAPDDKVQETTAVLSGALSPFAGVPLSLSVIQPFSYIKDIDRHTSQTGMEDTIIGARYRYDLQGLQQRFDREGNFLTATVALELPTGSIDHEAFDGPLDAMFALLGSVERGAISVIGYAFYRYNGSQGGSKDGDNLIVGTGLAWTPVDDPAGRGLLSFQLGLSYETYARDREAGVRLDDTGGWGLLVHPTIVWQPNERWQIFALVSLLVAQDYRNLAQEEHWRVGFGVTRLFGD